MKPDEEELEEEGEEYNLEDLIFPEDLNFIARMHRSKIGIYFRKWVAQEKREQALKASPPAPYEVDALTPTALAKTVQESREKIAKGDFTEVESQLITQAVALNGIFEVYTQKMISEKYHESQRIFGQLALKAQSQARKTLITLVELKNPKKLTFIKQQSNTQINLNKQTSGDS